LLCIRIEISLLFLETLLKTDLFLFEQQLFKQETEFVDFLKLVTSTKMASRDDEELDQSESTNQDQEEEVEEQGEAHSEQYESSGEASDQNEKSKVSSDNDSDEEFAGFGEEEIELKAKKRAVVSDERFATYIYYIIKERNKTC